MNKYSHKLSTSHDELWHHVNIVISAGPQLSGRFLTWPEALIKLHTRVLTLSCFSVINKVTQVMLDIPGSSSTKLTGLHSNYCDRCAAPGDVAEVRRKPADIQPIANKHNATTWMVAN